MTMQIKPGFYITRDGRLVEVIAVGVVASAGYICRGLALGNPVTNCWWRTSDGFGLEGVPCLVRPATQEEIERLK